MVEVLIMNAGEGSKNGTSSGLISSSGPRARLFILSDVRLYREGLRWSLAREQTLEMLGAADLSRAVVGRLVGLQPDAVILDVGAPESFAIAKLLGTSLPKVKIVAFAVSEVYDLVLACAEAGVAAYVTPEGSEKDLVAAVHHALRGELFCSPRIAGMLFRHVAALSGQTPRPVEQPSLTRRERQILGLVGEGMSNKEIGRVLRIGDATVKNHVHNILEKLQVNRRGEAAAHLRATRSGSRAGAPGQRRPASGAPLHPEPAISEQTE
jgi:two-component system nitrate/nitrite response regulator NarL